MNLIEQQQKARALPMQYLQQAVNGQSVELAPWIATAELQRRTTADQHMQNAQGPQGPQPTVKDQVEQKAGLMATQAAQQAQAAQAQQSSPPPGPVPEGVPQPEPQPEEPVMAARGGLMNAPVNFKFAHGGILGFAEAGAVPDPNARKMFIDEQGVERYVDTGQPVQAGAPAQGLRAGLEKYATEPTKERTLEDTFAESRAIRKEAGTDQPMGVAQSAQQTRQDELQKQQQEQAKKLAWSAFVQGTVGGPGAGSLAYDQTMANALGQGAEYGQQKYKNIAELEAARRAAGEKQQTGLESATAANRLASAAERKDRAGVGGRLYESDVGVATAKMQDLTNRYTHEQANKTQLKIAELTRALQSNQFNRQEARDAANQLNQMGQRAEADVNNLRAQYTAARKEMIQEEIDRVKPLLENAEAVQRSVVAAIGKSAGVAVPTATPAPATRLKFDAQGKPIK